MLVALVVILGLTSVPATAAARTFYVSTQGSDEADGSEADPWRTIYYGMEQLRAGDSLYVRGGTYTERIETLRPLPRGESDARITVRNHPGERPVVEGRLNIFKGGAHYWTFDGINVTWDPDTGQPNEAMIRMVDGVGWEIRNAEIWGNRSNSAIRVFAETDGLARDWAITRNCIHDTYPTNSFNNDHNIYVGADSKAGIAPGRGTISENLIFGAPNGANIKLGPGESSLPGTKGVVVSNNIMASAMQNVVIAWDSHDNTVEDNILVRGSVPSDKGWYPNVRGLDLSGHGNLAQNNIGWNAPDIIGNKGSQTAVADGGGNRHRDPEFASSSSCAGVRDVRDAPSRAYGPDPVIERVAGADRVQTSVRLSRHVFADGAPTLVLSRSDAYADALAGAPLAKSLGGPILLTPGSQLDPNVADEIVRLAPNNVILLGGEGALSEAVEREVRDLVPDVERVAGKTRFDTAGAIASRLDGDRVFLVEGMSASPDRGWPDAVSVAPYAARLGNPILLTLSHDLPDGTRDALRSLDPARVTIVGGTSSVSEEVADEVRDPDGDGNADVQVDRLAGSTRYDTSIEVAWAAVQAGADQSDVWLATGQNWADALASGPAVASMGGTLLLVHGGTLDASPGTRAWVRDRVTGDRAVHVLGGFAVVGTTVSDELATILVGN